MAEEERLLRKQLVELLRGGNAHADAETCLKDFPLDKASVKPDGSPHSVWQLLEHMRVALHDLLEFSINSNYIAPKWPDDYWLSPERASQSPSAEEWEKSAKAFREDLKAFENLVNDRASNLYAEIPWGEGQTLLREILVAADHNSYHLGQIVLLRKQLGVWSE